MTGLYRDFASPDALDDAYRVDRSVSDIAAYGPRYAKASAVMLDRPDATLGVRYGLTRDEYLDVYPAAGTNSGPAPVLLFIHGGYWRAYSARDFAFAARGPGEHGVLTLVANYSLAPRAPMSEIVRQMRAAIIWAMGNVARFGGDPARIAVAGHSAGGHLAAMTGLTAWDSYDLPDNPLCAVHAISGVFDLRPMPYTYLAPYLQLGLHDVLQLSPMLLDLPARLPPFRLSYGAAETAEFHRQSEDFASRLRGAGHRAETMPLAGENHMDAVFGLDDPGSAITRSIVGPLGFNL